MPFLTYSIEERICDKISIDNKNNVDQFINRIEDLNYKSKAIFIAENKNTIDHLSKKFIEMSKKIESGDDHIIRDTIFRLTQILNESYFYDQSKNNEEVKIDFKKNVSNEINKKLFFKYNKDVFDPSNFDKSVDKFKEDFLDKIKTFIISMNSEKKVINSICIFHKELTNYLLPWKIVDNKRVILINQSIETSLKDPLVQKDPKKHKSWYPENVKKITEGTKILFNWWNSISEKFRPEKFLIVSDNPHPNLSKTHHKNFQIKKIYEDYLFGNQEINKFKANVNFLDKSELNKDQWWKHKRHFAFGKLLSLLIWSEFGIEFINEKDNTKLNSKNQFIIDNNPENEHRQEIMDIIENF